MSNSEDKKKYMREYMRKRRLTEKGKAEVRKYNDSIDREVLRENHLKYRENNKEAYRKQKREERRKERDEEYLLKFLQLKREITDEEE